MTGNEHSRQLHRNTALQRRRNFHRQGRKAGDVSRLRSKADTFATAPCARHRRYADRQLLWHDQIFVSLTSISRTAWHFRQKGRCQLAAAKSWEVHALPGVRGNRQQV